ncbi:MAG: sugar transferase [Clostridiaceae bacterium]|nr:sugar transferase [Clostridiaceae bacterium]MCI9483687.1 sugar transferase [Clostridiaceae bacterium]NBH78381.1 sugar transferase [Clostridiaceae bacterium]NBI81060.1 sugar transferase [Clostridiaceae bacterium]
MEGTTSVLCTERMGQVMKASERQYWKVKRGMDILLSLALIVVCSPVMLLIALLIVLDDPHTGPVFKQTRFGLRGKPFTMYKFRTMIADAESRLEELREQNEMDGPVFKIRDDPRITRVGRVLRKLSLDELPQFFNVLKGDLSMIGPRPPLPCEAAEYTEYQKLRLYVKPGLSCSWQVRKGRNDVEFEEWVEDDINYILNASLWLDIKLFLQTPIAMLRGGGC